MKHKLVMVMLSIALIVSLALTACVPEAVPEVEEEEEEKEEEVPEVEVIEWRFHTPHTDVRPEYDDQKGWCDMIYEATDGRLKVTIYPGGALGFKDADMLRVCGGGTIESFMYYGGYVARDDPALGMLLPNLVLPTREDIVKLLPFAREQYKELYAKWNIRLLSSFLEANCNAAVMGREECNSIESLQGKKVRCWEFVQAETLKELGVAGEILPQAELYLALKTGVFDAGIQYMTGALGFSLYEVAPYYSNMYPTPDDLGVCVNEDAFRALPADIQAIVLEKSEEYTQLCLDRVMDCSKEEKAMELGVEEGMIVLPDFSDEDKELMSETALQVWRARAEEIGGEALEYQKIMEKEMKRLGLI